MASLAESQAFLDQFDKCLPLCERGDAVTVLNALHTLNTITQASITQALELDPVGGKDFVCSFLIELELALELFISPAKMLGTEDGGLPAMYSFTNGQLFGLVEAPSPSTKEKVRKFLKALGVEPSAEFELRTIAQTVHEFLKYQVQPSTGKCPARPTKARESRSISWADECSVGSDDYDSDVPGLGDEGSDDEEAAFSDEEESNEVQSEDSDEEDEEAAHRSAAAIFLWAAPVKLHDAGESREEEASGTPTRRSSGDSTSTDSIGIGGSKKGVARPVEPFFKTRKCKNWEQSGSCPFGDRCNFAHGDEELRAAEANVLLLSGTGSKPATRRVQEGEGAERWDRRPNQGKPNTGNYKTRLCKNFEASGKCTFGDKCMFAHGLNELRKLVKTKQCTTFAATGKCPYGSECNYAHGPGDQLA